MAPNASMFPVSEKISDNGNYILRMQTDGNLVLYMKNPFINDEDYILWSTSNFSLFGKEGVFFVCEFRIRDAGK